MHTHMGKCMHNKWTKQHNTTPNSDFCQVSQRITVYTVNPNLNPAADLKLVMYVSALIELLGQD